MEKCPNCNNEVIYLKPLKCKFCPLKFCSITCLMNHNSVHNNSKNEEAKKLLSTAKRKYSRKLSQKYIFITPGIFHEENEGYSKEYSFENFSKVLDGFIAVELGSGSYGRVYLVSHNETKEKYALKVIDKKKLLNMYGNCDIIYNEIKIHSKLEHPNIIRLYSFKETEYEINIIMEYAKNGNLYQLISKNKKGFSEQKAFHYFIQVVNAVYFLHENQIIHRDIKPENLLIGENDTIKLCDFGWAKNLTLKNRSSYCGTVEYMAPEIIESDNYDFSVDIWSLGILLYELLFGHSPFKDKTTKNTIVNIKLHELKFDKEISEDCKDLINKLLEVNKEKRINIKDILTHNFVKKNQNFLNSITPNRLFNNNISKLSLYNENEYEINSSNINSNSNSNNCININSNDIQISRSFHSPFKVDYSNSSTSFKFDRYSNNNISFTTPKKLFHDNSIRDKLKFGRNTGLNLKNNPYFAKINQNLNTEIEKSKKKIGFLTLTKNKRYSFEEIKEHNKKMEEEKKNCSNNMPKKINREFVKVDTVKNNSPSIQDSEHTFPLPSFNENIFINELMNICRKHSKDNLVIK